MDALGRSVRDSAPFARGGPRETAKAAQGQYPSTAEANAQPIRIPLNIKDETVKMGFGRSNLLCGRVCFSCIGS